MKKSKKPMNLKKYEAETKDDAADKKGMKKKKKKK